MLPAPIFSGRSVRSNPEFRRCVGAVRESIKLARSFTDRIFERLQFICFAPVEIEICTSTYSEQALTLMHCARGTRVCHCLFAGTLDALLSCRFLPLTLQNTP